MTGYPPNDGSFPGNPGEPPFPGQPGQPGQPPQPGQPGHGGGQPRFQPPPPPPPGRPGAPYGGQPGGYPPGYGAPGGPYGGPGGPGGVPPRQPPVPGQPGPGGPPRRNGRLALIIGASVTAVALLATGGLLVWNLSESRPYADLPSCRRLLPSELLDSMPETEGLSAEGDYEEGEEVEYREEEHLLGYLWCDVDDDGEDVVSVFVNLVEYEDDGAAVEDIREETANLLEDLESGDWEDDLGADLIDWRPLGAGDGGASVLYEPDYPDEEIVHGFASFTTANLGVTVFRVLRGEIEAEEELDRLDDLAREVGRQLSREGERA